MNEYSKLILVAAILVVFGVAVVSTSSFKIFFDKAVTLGPTSGVLPIQANSSSDFVFWFVFGGFPKSDQVWVVVSDSPELQNLLNPTLNYSSIMNVKDNITISIVGNQNISASVRAAGGVAAHLFDIPSDWEFGFYVRVTNPENYPVCLVVTVLLYGQVVDNTWRTALIVGIASVILGLATVRIANNRRNRIERALDRNGSKC